MAVFVELLDAVVEFVGDVDPADGAHRHALWIVELAAPAAEVTPLVQEGAVGVELLDPVVVGVGDVDVSGGTAHRDALWKRELAVPAARCAPPLEELVAGAAEHGDAVAAQTVQR